MFFEKHLSGSRVLKLKTIRCYFAEMLLNAVLQLNLHLFSNASSL